MLFLLVVKSLTVALILIIHPVTSARVISFLLDCAIRLCTSSFVLGRVVGTTLKQYIVIDEVQCVRLTARDDDDKVVELPFAKIDSFCPWPQGFIVGGFELQCQFVISLLFGSPASKTTITTTIHIEIREIKIDLQLRFILFYRWIISKLFSTTTTNDEQNNSLQFKNCIGNNGTNFLSIVIDGKTAMICIQCSPQATKPKTTTATTTTTKTSEYNYTHDDRVLSTNDDDKKKQKKTKKQGMPLILRLLHHVLERILITNFILNCIASFPADSADSSSSKEFLMGLSIGFNKFQIQSSTTTTTTSSCLVLSKINASVFSDWKLKKTECIVAKDDVFCYFPLLLCCPAKNVVDLSLSNLTGLLTFQKQRQGQRYEIIVAALFSSSSSDNNDDNNNNIDYSQQKGKLLSLNDIEIQCRITNILFVIQSLLPSFLALGSSSMQPDKQYQQKKNNNNTSKQQTKFSTWWLPKQEAWFECGIKINILDDTRQQKLSKKVYYNNLELHTVIRANFITSPSSATTLEKEKQQPSLLLETATASTTTATTTTTTTSTTSDSQLLVVVPANQEQPTQNITNNSQIVHVLSISFVDTFVRIVGGGDLLWLKDLEIEFHNNMSSSFSNTIEPKVTSHDDDDDVFSDTTNTTTTKRSLFICLGLVKTHVESQYLEIVKKILSLLPPPSSPNKKGYMAVHEKKKKNISFLTNCPIECNFNCCKVDICFIDDDDDERYPLRLNFIIEALQVDLRCKEHPNSNNSNGMMQVFVECHLHSEVIFASIAFIPPAIPLISSNESIPNNNTNSETTTIATTADTAIMGFIREFSGKLILNNEHPNGKGSFHVNEILIQEECNQGDAWNNNNNNNIPLTRISKNDGRATSTITVAMVKFAKCDIHPLHPQDDMHCKIALDGEAIVLWHAVLQWKVCAALQTAAVYLNKLKNFFSTSKSNNRPASLKKKPSINLQIQATNVLKLHAILGNGNEVKATLCRGVTLNVTTLASRRKPDVCVLVKHCTVYMNDQRPAVAQVTDLVFSDCSRTATDSEISAYEQNRKPGAAVVSENNISDDLVTDLNGSPLFESIILTASNIIFRVAPDLHFGQVLDDFEKTMKGLQVGLAAMLLKRQQHQQKCYQLMSIRSTFCRVDASILESDIMVSSDNNISHCHRFRAIFRRLDVSIDRLDPPSHRKSYLNALDEDPSEFRDYGPPVQGGYIIASFQKAIVLVDPLTLAVPLAIIQDLHWKGTAMIAGLSPQTSGLFGDRKANVPVMSISCSDGTRKQYGFEVPFKGIPAKFYLDGTLDARELSVNFGVDVQAVLPQILAAIDRIKPPSAPTESLIPSLGWWDSLRFFIHGQVVCDLKSISLRWLLDSTNVPEWSVMIQSEGFRFRQSVGRIFSEFISLVVSVPRDSYPLHSFDTTVLDASRSGLRHSLILIPVVNLDLTFSWSVFSGETSSPLKHHSPYFASPGDSKDVNGDKFHLFRSHGVSVCLKSDISVGAVFSNWIALRIDVLPWLTHNGHRFAELSRANASTVNKKPSPKLELNGIDATVSMSELKLAVWHGPLDTKGVCLIITGATATRVNGCSSSICSNKNELHLERVQAVLLDVPLYEGANQHSILVEANAVHLGALDKFDQISAFLGSSHEVMLRAAEPKLMSSVPLTPTGTTEDEKNIFYALKLRLETTCAVDYLVEVSSLLLMDHSLTQSIRDLAVDVPTRNISTLGNVESKLPLDDCQTKSSKDGEIVLEKDERTWTVLVSGMKLLWTIDIRDAVVLLVGDFMRTSELMKLQLKVSSRGQKKVVDVNKLVYKIRPTLGSRLSDDDVNAENSFQRDEPKSSLLRLLEESNSNDGDDVTNKGLHIVEYPVDIANEHSESDGCGESDDASTESDANPSFPVLVIHLFNPQIQLHSEQTGGGIILAMRRCYVEGKQFNNYFADYSFDSSDVSFNEGNPKVLRKKEFRYQLEEVEAFSVNTEVDVDAGLQWLDLGDIVESKGSNYLEASGSFESFSPRYFLCEATMRKIIKSFSFRTRQLFFRQPLDLSPDEIGHLFSNESIIKVGGSFGSKVSVMDSVEAHLDQLSFELDSYQFSTTLDLIKNLILAPPPVPRKLHADISKASAKNLHENTAKETEGKGLNDLSNAENPPVTSKASGLTGLDNRDDSDSSISSQSEHNSDSEFGFKGTDMFGDGESPPNHDELQRIVLEWRDSQNSKRDRDTLRVAVQNLLSLLEEQQSDSRLIRYIEWSLSKASWKIYSPDILDDVEIELTSLRGMHQFSSDSSMTTQLELEDLRINSLKPSAEAMNFIEPGAVLATSLGAERTPCQRCGAIFDRASNYMQSCRFHGHDYGSAGRYLKTLGAWSCCGASLEGAPGCKTSPHTGRERVALVRVESLPKKIKGISLYKHVEVNIYPEVPHTLIVQMTKSVSKLFVSYFIGDNIKGSAKQGILDAQQSKHLGDDDKSDIVESLPPVQAIEKVDSMKKRSNLFGKQQIFLRKGNASTPAMEENKATASSDCEDRDALASCKKEEEIVFVKHLRIGNINTEISLIGFPIETHDYGIGVPAFTRAYKIGTNSYLSRKYVSHVVHEVVKSVAHSGLSKVRERLRGEDRPKRNQLLANTENSARKLMLLGTPTRQATTTARKLKRFWSKTSKDGDG